MSVYTITSARRPAKLVVIGLLTVYFGLLSREKLLLEEEKSHGYYCVVGSVCNWTRYFCNVGALYEPSTRICPEIALGFKSLESEMRRTPTATLRAGVAPMI
jgi:hypothetical protein